MSPVDFKNGRVALSNSGVKGPTLYYFGNVVDNSHYNALA